MAKFKIGDVVKIKNSTPFEKFVYTKPGSYGTIIDIDDKYEYKIEFTYLNNPDWEPVNPTYYIKEEWLELDIERYTKPADKKYEKVIKKIKQLESKQKWKFKNV